MCALRASLSSWRHSSRTILCRFSILRSQSLPLWTQSNLRNVKFADLSLIGPPILGVTSWFSRPNKLDVEIVKSIPTLLSSIMIYFCQSILYGPPLLRACPLRSAIERFTLSWEFSLFREISIPTSTLYCVIIVPSSTTDTHQEAVLLSLSRWSWSMRDFVESSLR